MAIGHVFHPGKTQQLTIQGYNARRARWSDLTSLAGVPVDLGRKQFQVVWGVTAEDLAENHMRIMVDENQVFIEPFPSLNGVYLKLKPNRPVPLTPGSRFRMGRHVLEFRAAEESGPDSQQPLRSDEGEVFQARALTPLGFIDVIGPDGKPCLSHPLTKTDEPGTRIGREGPRCDLALVGDNLASSEHARIYFSGTDCFLEDLKSTNGTFLRLPESRTHPIERGTASRPDSGDVVAIGSYLICVIEERP